ncbi:serine/threonine protein kinase [Paenibacillus sophorae]|uniref:Serine/threonine-protein kinase PrkC n=1 Tax=Paenibacillus sophorae TaxID=1333845 RepID=A0A1H8JVF7_9BACL|nr:Stk1 family PASTA domain-containing Ser/Thr kinase [Paenibacillus sophorae]QWU13498.1 Stk1 family PASTA domain-containing Ser/Thr kinase [Paenibacillus sophorae]SEN84581.1 serine/threonine protein kinase [Paenibacillus sophorae]
MIGHELGGRYQVIERIGGGGMALVYRAHDILLNRNVAIKVLRNQFVHDEEFIRRFRREAQSAASLSHPNVVSIYDVGQEDEIHYIVMEYVEGKNLNEIIKERAPLQVDEAVRIATQICDALDHAHQNQIIHRDIKPHNILIGRNGRVKVTDFGIARAVTSTTITQTGSVVGSVHYFSPEHAKGVATGEKSDLYSLGIVIYQMLTGSLPFLGESPISVALKHLQEEFEEPRKLNSMIPQSVENIILKSMRKNPEERYQSAKEMLQDLETCLLPERRSEPKLSFLEDDEDRTRVMPAIKPNPRSNGLRSRGEDRMIREEDTPSGKKRKDWGRPALWIGLTLLLLIAMAGVVWYVNAKLVVPEVTVPKLVSLSLEDAKAKLSEAGLVLEEPVTTQYNPNYAEGIVFEQSKEPDTTVKEGTTIALKVSIAKPLQQMPDLSGMTYDDAVKALMAQGVEQSRITQDSEFSKEVQEGEVLRQNPISGSQYDPDTAAISITVSKGQESITMPDLTGLTESDAKAKLEELGLELGDVKTEASFSVEKGKITKQWPYEKGAAALPGEKITIYISDGYPPEALEYTFNLPVSPVQEGKKTKIRIEFVDARNNGEKQDWGTRTISRTQVLSVNLILAPNKEGAVMVYRDGEFFDTYSVSYIDAKNGTVPIPEPSPVNPPSPSPAETPAETPAGTEPSADPVTAPGTEGTPPDTGGEQGVNQTGYSASGTQIISGQGDASGHKKKGKDKK